MKRSLVAIAALATVGAAFAQSSVTLYGRMDMEVTSKVYTSAAGVKSDAGMMLQNGGLLNSRWGMTGTEDLGGGMKAIFTLESGFRPDDGIIGTGGGGVHHPSPAAGQALLFGRVTQVGLKGGFGTIKAGRGYAAYDSSTGVGDSQGATNYTPYTLVINGGMTGLPSVHGDGGTGGPGRVSNMINYNSPTVSGFSGQFTWSPGENKTATTDASSYTGFNVMYSNGPLSLAFGQESVAPAVGPTNSAYLIQGNYDLGMAKVYALYKNAEMGAGALATNYYTIAGKDDGYGFGVKIPAGPANIQLSYATMKTTKTGMAVAQEVSAFGATVEYPLSKRTMAYAEMVNMKGTAAGAVKPAEAKQENFGVGLVHKF